MNGGMCNDHAFAKFLHSVSVKIIIWWSYGHKFGALYVWLTVYYTVYSSLHYVDCGC